MTIACGYVLRRNLGWYFVPIYHRDGMRSMPYLLQLAFEQISTFPSCTFWSGYIWGLLFRRFLCAPDRMIEGCGKFNQFLFRVAFLAS